MGADGQVAGGCHCGAVRYTMPVAVEHHTLCHCTDCRRHARAPAVAWAMASADAVPVSGVVTVYASSDHGRRHFCARCGTGLFYTNDAMFPGMIDVQTATLDDPDAIRLQAQIQLADRIGWMAKLDALPGFDRYPPMG
jgi:hypothetical protein